MDRWKGNLLKHNLRCFTLGIVEDKIIKRDREWMDRERGDN